MTWEISKTCDRMLIIDKGKIIYDGTADDIKEKYEIQNSCS